MENENGNGQANYNRYRSARGKKKRTWLVREGSYLAEVAIELIFVDEEWSPHISLDDALKLDDVRKEMRQGNIAAAAQMARVFKLIPLDA